MLLYHLYGVFEYNLIYAVCLQFLLVLHSLLNCAICYAIAWYTSTSTIMQFGREGQLVSTFIPTGTLDFHWEVLGQRRRLENRHFGRYESYPCSTDDITIGCDMVSMLTNAYPHKPLRKIKVAICNYQVDSNFTCLPDVFELMTFSSWWYISCHWDTCTNRSAINDLMFTRKHYPSSKRCLLV